MLRKVEPLFLNHQIMSTFWQHTYIVKQTENRSEMQFKNEWNKERYTQNGIIKAQQLLNTAQISYVNLRGNQWRRKCRKFIWHRYIIRFQIMNKRSSWRYHNVQWRTLRNLHRNNMGHMHRTIKSYEINGVKFLPETARRVKYQTKEDEVS